MWTVMNIISESDINHNIYIVILDDKLPSMEVY